MMCDCNQGRLVCNCTTNKQPVQSLYVSIKREEVEGMRARIAELEADVGRSREGYDEACEDAMSVAQQLDVARNELVAARDMITELEHKNCLLALKAQQPSAGVVDGLFFKDSQELAEALGAVKCLHDLSVELIAEDVFAQRKESGDE